MSDKDIIKHIKPIISDIQKYINDSYNDFSKIYLNLNNKHKLQIKQELICKSGLWTRKKRYALSVVDREGISIDKLEIKGLDVVKSSFPPAFAGFLKGLLKDILEEKPIFELNKKILELENSLDSISINDISRTTSINEISKYDNSRNKYNTYYKENVFTILKKGTPAHIKAAIKFNDLIDYFKLENKVPKIRNGEKIKWCYLKPNKLNIEALAFRGYEDPNQIMDFIKINIDKYKIYDRELKSKIKVIFDVLGWSYPTQATEIADLFFK